MAEFQSVGKLISILHRKARVYFQQQLKPLELSHGQVKIFMHLAQNDGVTQRELTETFQLDKSSTSFLINSMVKNGFVRKIPHPIDRRSQILSLTDKGHAMEQEVRAIFSGWTDLLLTDFSTAEREQLFSYLHRMIDNVNCVRTDRENS